MRSYPMIMRFLLPASVPPVVWRSQRLPIIFLGAGNVLRPWQDAIVLLFLDVDLTRLSHGGLVFWPVVAAITDINAI